MFVHVVLEVLEEGDLLAQRLRVVVQTVQRLLTIFLYVLHVAVKREGGGGVEVKIEMAFVGSHVVGGCVGVTWLVGV